LREETQFELMDLQNDLGTTFVVVTHDQEEAMTMADRIAVMNKGHIEQVGTPGEIYEQPQTRFIAEFVGDVNVLEGKVAGRDETGHWHVETSASQTFLTVDDPDEVLHDGQSVAIAIRPEKMIVGRHLPLSSPNLMSGEVWDIGYLGDWTVYRIRLDCGSFIRASRANVNRYVDNPISWDEGVQLSFAPDSAVILSR